MTTADLSTNQAAYELATAAQLARTAIWYGQQEQELAKRNAALAVAQELLAPFWRALGIDPTQHTLTSDKQHHWEGLTAFGDGAVFALPTHVHIYCNGIELRALDEKLYLRGTFYTPNGQGQGLQEALTAEKIGGLLLDAWLAAHKAHKKACSDRLAHLLRAIENNRPTWADAAAELEAHRRAVDALQPQELPEPFADSMARLRAALAAADLRFGAHRQQQEQARQQRAALVEAAERIKSHAIHWQRDHAAWRAACRSLAETVTRHYWRPFRVYELRYTAVGLSAFHAADESDGETPSVAVEAAYTLENPLTIARAGLGARVHAVTVSGETYELVIGAFLDGTVRLEAKQPPAVDARPSFYMTCNAAPKGVESGYYFHFPPLLTRAEMQAALDLVVYPVPPRDFAQLILDQLGILIRSHELRHAAAWDGLDPGKVPDHALDLHPELGMVIDARDRIPL
jgi:hypothetical protein